MKYRDIKDYDERCKRHPDHKQGMISNIMIIARLSEEIAELREYIEGSNLKERTHEQRNAKNLGSIESNIWQ